MSSEFCDIKVIGTFREHISIGQWGMEIWLKWAQRGKGRKKTCWECGRIEKRTVEEELSGIGEIFSCLSVACLLFLFFRGKRRRQTQMLMCMIWWEGRLKTQKREGMDEKVKFLRGQRHGAQRMEMTLDQRKTSSVKAQAKKVQEQSYLQIWWRILTKF